MNEAIKIAIENGYPSRNYLWNDAPPEIVRMPFKDVSEIWLDPKF
jgi:hypothetical protein